MDAWQTILASVASSGTLAVVLGFFGKSIWEKWAQRSMVKFETELKAKADIAIEGVRNQAQMRTIEHQIRFERLHERRAFVLAELNANLATAVENAGDLLSPFEQSGGPVKQEKLVAAMDSLRTLYRHFEANRIYLPQELCDDLEKLISEIRKHCVRFGSYVWLDEQRMESETHVDKLNAWQEGWEAVANQVPVARRAVEHEFRKLLDGSIGG